MCPARQTPYSLAGAATRGTPLLRFPFDWSLYQLQVPSGWGQCWLVVRLMLTAEACAVALSVHRIWEFAEQ